MLESTFQALVIKDLRRLFEGCIILKNDSEYLQGFPDLTVLFHDKYAILEVKANKDSPFQPNQVYYLELLGEWAFAACIYPENKDEVFYALQQAFRVRGTTRVAKRKQA